MEFIKIENRDTWLIKEIPNYHPDDPRHTNLWRQYKKECIEGIWGRDFDGYRFMPGNLRFYVNFGIILHAEKKRKSRYRIKPDLRDLEWERAYACLESFGFSGFSDDEYVSCNHYLSPKIVKTLTEKDLKELPKECFKGDGSLKEYQHPRDYLRKLHSQPLGKPLYHNNASNTIEMGCLHESVKVRMFDGSLKYSKDIQVGDKLMGINSTPRTVQNLVRGKGLMYDVHTNYNGSFRCTDSHLHQIRDISNGNILTLDTNEYLDKPKTKHNYHFEAIKSEAIQYPEKDLKLHPYFIGLWLGDGFKREKLICINEQADKEIKDWLVNYANSEERFSYTETQSKSGLTDSYTTRFRLIDNAMLYQNNWWSKTFLNNKHIPQEYMLSSIEQRLELLAGFIDSDGHYERGRYTICNIDLDLLKQTRELAQSLGFTAKIHKPSITGLKNSLKYNLRITGNISIIPCKIERKKARDTSKKGSTRNKIKIDLLSGKVEDFYGFELDGDNLYLLENYLVTHNSRGGGKSYWYAIGVNLYEIIFDGAKEYTDETRKNPAKTEVLIGAALTSKSNEFCDKIKFAMTELATNPDLGCWGKPGDEDYQPSPFYKDMKGSLEPNNAKNPYRHEYEKKVNGRWIGGFGTGSKILHVSFTTDNPEAAAGTRPARITVEELGLVPNILTVHGSNDACQIVDSTKFGSTHYLGTAGNIDKIVEARILFTEPEGYNILAYDDEWEHTGKIGFFLPAYYINNDFKDENGNTDVERAKAFYEKRRANAKKVSSQAYDAELMNFPLVPSEMFLGREGKILPVTELKEREKQLLLHNNYKKIGTAIDIFFDSSKKTGVDYRVLENTEPIYEFPTKRDANIEGCIMMYEAPIEINGVVPNDLYDLVGFDPYVSENLGDGESLGSVYVMKNPKYLSLGYGGNQIVCGYTGKHALGRTRFLENVEKILMMYGSPNQGLWFEGNRGDYVKGYFEKKYKLHQLCLRPQIEKGVRVLNRPVSEYGWITGNRISKIQLIDMLAEWLKEETTIDGVTKRNLERLPDIALVRECIAFDLDKGNYDRCFSKNTLITTNKGLKTIDNIQEGDLVLTKSLDYHPVVLTHKNKAEIVNVYIEGDSSPIETTANHPFYTKYNKTVKHNTRHSLLNEKYTNAEDLTSKDFVLLPKRKLTEEYYTNDELYLLGWFLGDGNINKSNNLVKFIFSNKELEQAEKIKNILDAIDSTNITRIKDKKNWYSLEKFSKPIKEWLNENCGTTSNKQINEKVFNSKNNFHFLLGFLEAEGHKTKAKGNIQISNTNKLAMRLIRQMLLDNSIYSSIRVRPQEKNQEQLAIDIPYTYTKIFKCSSKFDFEPTYKRERIKLNAIEKEEGFYCKVKKVEKTNRIEDTYNLSVLDDNTYFANNVLVHNCMALVGCIVGLREKVNQYEQTIINKNNPLALLANNNNLFNRHSHKLKKRKALLA